jgi:EAL domain-containing protein (putative c-di-GMP-specific phosphodiesterase class I)/DNA-binding response OmpR family regulator
LVVEAALDTSQALVASCAANGVGVVLIDDSAPRRPALLAPAVATLGAGAMRRAALEEAVALVAGRAPAAATLEHLPAEVGLQSAEAAVRQGRLVLVAEDNEINQELIRRQLALLKVQCEIAGDGVQALARWRSGRFSMLLTDLHMPGIDGYELAARIRSEERPGERLPIVALTANATKGEADRCRALGMDEYLTKPVDLDRLQAVLACCLRDPAFPRSPVPAVPSGLPVLDASVLPKLIGHDRALLARFNDDYLVSARQTVEGLRKAADAGNWSAAAALAHRLKSSSRAVGALALGEVCARLEDAGKGDDPTAVLSLVSTLEAALEAVAARLGEPPVPVIHELREPAGVELRIIVVDDEPFQLQLMAQQLLDLGFANCDTRTSGMAMLESLRGLDTSTCLVLLDLDMPDMDGVEVIRHLAEQEYAGALAVISGADERLLEAASKLAGAYRLDLLTHLHKPVPTDALWRLVKQWRWRRRHPPVPLQPLANYRPAEIRNAIASGQMVLHYQPKVCLKTGEVEGVEALLRWQHPTDGIVSPDRFVSVAEDGGLIDELTQEVISQALWQASRWRRSGLALRVAVNVSMDNLARLDFPERLLDALARAEVPATDLVLEVTESRLMLDARAPLDILTRLRLKQIGLSIDDFGTGHSSLAQLRDIPFDELKIDRGFVHHSDRRPTERAIFEASLGVAHQLGMRAVAEGVEDRADWDFVRASGCDIAQGYFIARPMPGEAVAAWIGAWHEQRAELLS